MKRKAITIIALCALLAFLLPAALDTRLRVVSYEIPSEKIMVPVRLAVLTDLHSCKYGERQRELLDAVTAQEPDAVALAGDIMTMPGLPPRPAACQIDIDEDGRITGLF